jgi:hypothetical protein
MALPKHIRPEYSTTIPSTGRRIKYQPFSVKEEKVLVLAAESQEPDEIVNAIENVLTSCVSSPADFNVKDLALFDIEYLFLKARAKSAGEKIKLSITDPDDETFSVDHEINIDKVGVIKNENHTPLIQLSETTSIKMGYPDVSFFNEGISTDNISSAINLIARLVEQIVIDEEVFNKEEMSEAEIIEWLEGLTTEDFKKVTDFFETMPRLKHSFTLHNTNTDKDFTIVLEGLADFF